MILVEKPSFGIEDILGTLGGNATETRLKDNSARLVAAEKSFDSLAAAETLSSFRSLNSEVEVALGTATRWAYRNRLLRGSGRGYYNRLRESSRHGLCPVCLVRQAREVDHLLPKSVFPELAITPLNLVPICDECNGSKLEHYGKTPQDESLHAYYDAFAAGNWLACKVDETPGAPLRYDIQPKATWSSTQSARVRFNFDKFGLAQLYADCASVELSGIRGYLSKLLDAGGAAEVSSYLYEMAVSFDDEPTLVWKASAYRAWAASGWFCAGGLELAA